MSDLIEIFDESQLETFALHLGHDWPAPEEPTLANASSVTVDPKPMAGAGARVTGQILKAANVGFRNGDHFIGEVTAEITDEVIIATDWNGRNYMGVARPYDAHRFIVRSWPHVLLHHDEFTILKIVARRSCKGTTWATVLPYEAARAKAKANTEKAAATRAANRARHQAGRRSGRG